MTVVGISKPGGPEVLLPETRAVPQPGPDEILIKVMAAGVNRPDVAQRIRRLSAAARRQRPARPRGRRRSGRGRQQCASKHKLGDKVMSLVAGGGYAQYCIAQDAQAMAVPPSLVDAGSRRHCRKR